MKTIKAFLIISILFNNITLSSLNISDYGPNDEPPISV